MEMHTVPTTAIASEKHKIKAQQMDMGMENF
jgi:hypothetical protein